VDSKAKYSAQYSSRSQTKTNKASALLKRRN